MTLLKGCLFAWGTNGWLLDSFGPFSWSGDAPEMTALRADEATLGPVRADRLLGP